MISVPMPRCLRRSPTGPSVTRPWSPSIRGAPSPAYSSISPAAPIFSAAKSELVADLVAACNVRVSAPARAIADTPGAASALARFGADSVSVVPVDAAAAVLKPLPLAALRLAADTIAALDRVGLKRIGQIMGAPRAPWPGASAGR